MVLDDGAHDLAVGASDGSGNSAAPVVITIDLDTEAPALIVTAPDDGSCSGDGATIEFAADDAHLDEVTALLNGSAIASGHVVDEDGDLRIEHHRHRRVRQSHHR